MWFFCGYTSGQDGGLEGISLVNVVVWCTKKVDKVRFGVRKVAKIVVWWANFG